MLIKLKRMNKIRNQFCNLVLNHLCNYFIGYTLKQWHQYVSYFAGLFCIFAATLATAESLPSPLTLQLALQLAQQNHPTQQLFKAQVELAKAQALEAKAKRSGELFLELESKRIQQTTNTDSYLNDGRIHIGAKQVLFDFGVSSATHAQHQYNIGTQIQLQHKSRIQHIIHTEQAYYDVLLADLRYTADNEIMTVAFLRYDKVKERHSLGIFSDLELAEAEFNYRILLNTRKNAEIRQRITRQTLATLLNKPDDVPLELVMPELKNQNKKSPDANTFYQHSLTVNPLILSLQNTINAQLSAVRSEKRKYFPTLTATVDFNEYQRELDSRNKIEFAVQLTLPLYDSGLRNAKTAQAISKSKSSQALLQLAKLQLRQKILEFVLNLDSLQVQKNTQEIELDFREYEVDKRRAEYELELKTNMGTAMANLTLAQWQTAKTNFQIELTWKKLNALKGIAPNTKPKDMKQ